MTTQIFVFLEIQMDYYIRMYIDIFLSVDSLILLRMLKSLERQIEYLGTEGVHIRSKMSESTL